MHTLFCCCTRCDGCGAALMAGGGRIAVVDASLGCCHAMCSLRGCCNGARSQELLHVLRVCTSVPLLAVTSPGALQQRPCSLVSRLQACPPLFGSPVIDVGMRVLLLKSVLAAAAAVHLQGEWRSPFASTKGACGVHSRLMCASGSSCMPCLCWAGQAGWYPAGPETWMYLPGAAKAAGMAMGRPCRGRGLRPRWG